MNSYQEKKLYERFKQTFNEFPPIEREIIDDQDKPDSIIITSDKRKIGIELTELFQDSDKNRNAGSKLKELESIQEKIGCEIVRRTNSNIRFGLDIDFSFKRISKSRKATIINEVCSFLEDKLTDIKENQTLSFSNYGGLPDEIHGIGITTIGKPNKSYFANSMGGVEADLSKEHLDSVLKSKHEEINNYEPCDEYWLIIKIGNFFAGSFDSLNIKDDIDSSFSKIIIHDIRDSSNHHLKVKSHG